MSTQLTSAVLSALNDQAATTPYGHGHLVALPLHYYDDDRVTLFVEPATDGYRVSDRGSTAMRLHMADVSLDAPRVADAWRQSVGSLAAFDMGTEEGVIAGWTTQDQLGEMILRVAEASLRVDQLRWMATEPRRMRFRDRVVRKLSDSFGEAVTPNAPLLLRSQRTRQVTAAIGDDLEKRVYIQAVGGSDRDKSVEHCYFLFSMSDIPMQRRIAVVDRGASWSAEMLREIDSVAELAFFDDDKQFRKVLRAGLQNA